jgi:hypothetical protein
MSPMSYLMGLATCLSLGVKPLRAGQTHLVLIAAFQRRRRFDTWTACECTGACGSGPLHSGLVEPQVDEFSRHICALCATRGTDVFTLAAKLRMDPGELLQMINGKVVPTKIVISGLARELHSSVSFLTKLAAESIRDTW